jgi:hypothetical protein
MRYGIFNSKLDKIIVAIATTAYKIVHEELIPLQNSMELTHTSFNMNIRAS